MTAESYNRKQYRDGDLTDRHLVTLVEFWQRHHHDLAVDGYAGPNTLVTLRGSVFAIKKFWPLLCLAGGRTPVITSGFYTENPSRPTHKGVDLFYPWLDSDPDVSTGDGGAIKRNGRRRWWYPPGAVAIAAADGIVQLAGEIGTGWRCWLDHYNGERTGYFHGAKLLVEAGDKIKAGTPVIEVGHNPKGHDAKHLHFEVSPADRYAPMNPRTWLRGAQFITSP